MAEMVSGEIPEKLWLRRVGITGVCWLAALITKVLARQVLVEHANLEAAFLDSRVMDFHVYAESNVLKTLCQFSVYLWSRSWW
jgi:hypothetical protein